MVIRGARKRPHPYAVKVLKHTDFADIKELAAKKIKNRTRNTDGGIVNWLNIKWLRLEKSAPHTIQYKHRIQSKGFMKLIVSSVRDRRRRPETTCQLDAFQMDAVNFQRANETRSSWTRPNATRPR